MTVILLKENQGKKKRTDKVENRGQDRREKKQDTE